MNARKFGTIADCTIRSHLNNRSLTELVHWAHCYNNYSKIYCARNSTEM